jgi:hypothetical protein
MGGGAGGYSRALLVCLPLMSTGAAMCCSRARAAAGAGGARGRTAAGGPGALAGSSSARAPPHLLCLLEVLEDGGSLLGVRQRDELVLLPMELRGGGRVRAHERRAAGGWRRCDTCKLMPLPPIARSWCSNLPADAPRCAGALGPPIPIARRACGAAAAPVHPALWLEGRSCGRRGQGLLQGAVAQGQVAVALGLAHFGIALGWGAARGRGHARPRCLL